MAVRAAWPPTHRRDTRREVNTGWSFLRIFSGSTIGALSDASSCALRWLFLFWKSIRHALYHESILKCYINFYFMAPVRLLNFKNVVHLYMCVYYQIWETLAAKLCHLWPVLFTIASGTYDRWLKCFMIYVNRIKNDTLLLSIFTLTHSISISSLNQLGKT